MSQPRRDPGWLRRWWPLYTVLIALAPAWVVAVGAAAAGRG